MNGLLSIDKKARVTQITTSKVWKRASLNEQHIDPGLDHMGDIPQGDVFLPQFGPILPPEHCLSLPEQCYLTMSIPI